MGMKGRMYLPAAIEARVAVTVAGTASSRASCQLRNDLQRPSYYKINILMSS